eukprot:2474090-Pyramimonas_sp.AAC.1
MGCETSLRRQVNLPTATALQMGRTIGAWDRIQGTTAVTRSGHTCQAWDAQRINTKVPSKERSALWELHSTIGLTPLPLVYFRQRPWELH